MGVHTGEAQLVDGDYIGLAVHQAARVSSAAHGGQVLVSQTAKDLVGSSLPEGATLVDLGEHRLKDLAQPTRLYNIAHAALQAELPPPRTLSVLPNNLPLQLTSFVGREEEIAKVTKLLETARLITLSGAGGSGKTRLALQIAADLVTDHREGVWLADLAPITDPDLIMRGVAEALGVREEKDRSVEDVLIEFLQGKDLLVVIDNCEHLAEESAAVIDRLLHAASGLRVIATSRETLGAEGESVFRVPSLDTPKTEEPPETLASYEAVRLFCDRASQATADFGLTTQNARSVTEICRRLDGMPLAIELAAARVRMLTPQEIAKRLDDRFKLLTGGLRTGIRRQQTLRAAVDWSYEMLSPEERLLFRRLSVFVGGFTLEAAEGVCAGDGIEQGDVFDLLGNLVDRSLVVAEPHDGTTRYRLLETMREYGREVLAGSGEAPAMWGRHLALFTELAERVEPELEAAGEAEGLAGLDPELDNVRQALSWATADGDAVVGVRLASALYRYWLMRWLYAEGARWLSAMLEPCKGRLTNDLKAKALMALGNLAFNAGDVAGGRSAHQECVALPHEPGTLRWIAKATNDLGMMAGWIDGDADRLRSLLEEGLEMRRRIGHRHGIAESLVNIAGLEYWVGNEQQARELTEESLRIYEELGNRSRIGHLNASLAVNAFREGNLDRARELTEAALRAARETGERAAVASRLNDLGRWALFQGDLAEARRLHEEAFELGRAIESDWGLSQTLRDLGYLALEQGQLAQARAHFESFLRDALDVGSKLFAAFATSDLSNVAYAEGNLAEARTKLDEAVAVLEASQNKEDVPLLRARAARLARREGKLDEARALAQEAVDIAAQRDESLFHAMCSHELGLVAAAEADGDQARESLCEALRIRHECGLRPALAQTLEALGWVAAAFGRGERAAQLLGTAEELRGALGTVIYPVDRPDHEEAVRRAKADLGEGAFDTAWAKGRTLSLDEAVALALEA